MKAIFLKYKLIIAIVAAIALLAIGFFVGRATIDGEPKIEYVKGETIYKTVPGPDIFPVHSEIPSNPVLPMKPAKTWLNEYNKASADARRKDDSLRKIMGLPPQIVYETRTEFMEVDTSAIIQRYITKKSYATKLFDNDTTGKLIVNSTVQYNELTGIGYEFTPMIKQVKIERKRKVTPFLQGSYNTFNQVGGGVGVYIRSVGVGAKYVKDFSNNRTGYEGGIFIKF